MQSLACKFSLSRCFKKCLTRRSASFESIICHRAFCSITAITAHSLLNYSALRSNRVWLLNLPASDRGRAIFFCLAVRHSTILYIVMLVYRTTLFI